MARGLIFVLIGTLSAGCHKSPPPPLAEPSVAIAAVETKTAPSPASSLPELPMGAATACRAPAAERIIAIGDLHGDLKAAKHAFKLGGAIDASDHWVGSKLVVVQTGDVLDRGDEDRDLLAFLDKEQDAAKKAGGAVYRLNGNHEVMNVQGDFRYVTERSFKSYADEPRTRRPDAAERPLEQQGRAEAFLPGGREARKLAAFPVVWMVGDTLFAHGGVEPKHIKQGLDKLNREMSAWMRGEAPLPKQLEGEHTPFWTRVYGEAPAAEGTCASLERVLYSLKAARLVIGHTPQKSGITFDCDRKLARIDVGLSAYYGDNPTEVLEITGSNLKVLHEAARAAAAQ